MQILKQNRKEYGNLENFGNTKEKRDQNIISLICSGDRSLNEAEVRTVLQKIDEYGITPLEVGQKVKILALHPRVNTLHTGSILTSNIVSAHIQFDREDLGVCLIKDTDMIPFDNNPTTVASNQLLLNDIRDMHLNPQIKSLLKDENNQSKPNLVPIMNTLMDENNVNSMAMMQLLLDRKARILQELKRMNEVVNNNPAKGETEEFKQKYAWVSLQLLVTNAVIEPVLTYFRFRKLKDDSPKDEGEICRTLLYSI